MAKMLWASVLSPVKWELGNFLHKIVKMSKLDSFKNYLSVLPITITKS